MSTITMSDQVYGCQARDLRVTATDPSAVGAHAALESFYFAFNQRSLPVFDAVWAEDSLIQLNNPLGGIQRGHAPIRALYRRIFEGPARVWVELHDIVEYIGRETAVFAGRERGEFTLNGVTVPLNIRTTRIFHYLGSELGWRQVHHHGSIDTPSELHRYQSAVSGQAVDGGVTQLARVEVRPDGVQAFEEATRTLVAASREEAGARRFDLYQSTEQANRFFFYEVFDSAESLAAHRAEPHTKAWFAIAAGLLLGNPEIINLRTI